jgi:NAD(P)H-dependent FMN reductase
VERLYLPILYGSVRKNRRSFSVATFAQRLLEKRPDVETRLFDPRDLPFGNLVEREWEIEAPAPEVREFVREMGRADGFVVVTPEYNFGIPGALKNLLDHVYDEWNRKPFAMVTAGGTSGGLRAADQLRQVVSGVGAFVVPAHVSVQFIGEAFNEGGPTATPEVWEERFGRLFRELEWYARTLRPARLALAAASPA